MDENRCFRWDAEDLILSVRVLPRSSRDEVLGIVNAQLRVKTTAAPADGKANKAITTLLAKEFGVPGSRVELLRGHTSRDKLMRIVGPVLLPPCLSV